MDESSIQVILLHEAKEIHSNKYIIYKYKY